MIDDELSRAVVAYLRGARLAWPHRSLEAVAGAVGADTAERLGPQLKRLADETLYWPVDWDRHDLLSATEVVRGGFAERHPELTRRRAGRGSRRRSILPFAVTGSDSSGMT